MKQLFYTLFAIMACYALFSIAPSAALAAANTPSTGTCNYAIRSAVDNLVDDLFDDHVLAGMTLAISEDGELICEKGYGVRDAGTQEPMMPYTRSSIGSTTKVFATMAMMHLIENPPANKPGIGILTPVYADILSAQDYEDAYEQGIQQHYPIVGAAMGTDEQLVTWYSDGTYTIGTHTDLDAHQGPAAFTLPPNQTMASLIDIARGGPDNQVYSWYRDGRYSIGTPDDLGAFGSFITWIDGEAEDFQSRGISEIVGIGMNEAADRFIAFYHDGVASYGSDPSFLADATAVYTVPGDAARRYDIVAIARTSDENAVPNYVALYSDGKSSIGSLTDLGAFSGLANSNPPVIAGAQQAWRDAYTDMRIYHLLSHTAGFMRSDNRLETARKYGDVASYHPGTNTPSWKDRNRYMISTQPLQTLPGTDYAYSNHGMGLVGHLIEEISGDNWFTYLDEHILDPAGATRMTTYGQYYIDGQDDFEARPHRLVDGELVGVSYDFYNHSGSSAGALKGSAGDMVRILLATDREPTYPDVLEASTLNVMEAQWFPAAASNMLLGWHVDCQNATDCSDTRKLWHNGSFNGSIAYMARYDAYQINAETADGISVAMVINREHRGTLLSDMGQLADDIAEVVESIDYPELTLPNSDSINWGDLNLSFGVPNPANPAESSPFELTLFNGERAVLMESHLAGAEIGLDSAETKPFPPDGWVCIPHINFCTPSVIVQVAPNGCPAGWSDSTTPGSCQSAAGGAVDPSDIVWNLGADALSFDCPTGWVRPVGSPFCTPEFVTIDDPNGTMGRPDGCPPSWVESNAPGGCSPEFVAATPVTPGRAGADCPDGFSYAVAVNFCVADSLVAQSNCSATDAPAACNDPEWDVYLADTYAWESMTGGSVSANHLRFSRPDGQTAITAASVSLGWTCDIQPDLTAKCYAAPAIVDSCVDGEACRLLSTPTAVQVSTASVSVRMIGWQVVMLVGLLGVTLKFGRMKTQ